jgi:hemerythrin-like metal-binding protein
MDRQHDRLFGMIEAIYAQIGSDDRVQHMSALHGTIATFVEAATAHFSYECGLMEQTGFPGSSSHLADHRVIAMGVIQLAEAINAGQSPTRVLNETLTVWQAHHIGGMDVALARHVEQSSQP